MSDVKRIVGNLKIADAGLRRIKKYCGKKNKRHYRKRKKIQSIL